MPSKTEDQSSGQAQESMRLLMSTGERSHLNRWISGENLSWTTSTSKSSPGLQAIEWVSDQENQPFAGTLRKPPVTPSSAFWQYLDFHWASPLYSVNTLSWEADLEQKQPCLPAPSPPNNWQTFFLTHNCIFTIFSVWVGTSWFSLFLCGARYLPKFPCIKTAKLMKTLLSNQTQQLHQETF